MRVLICAFSFTRRLDDNIRTVVRGQTNVGQDGRQVGVSHVLTRSAHGSVPCAKDLHIIPVQCGITDGLADVYFQLSRMSVVMERGFDRPGLCEMMDSCWE